MISIYKEKLKTRALSWSQMYMFNNNIEGWYDKYVLGIDKVVVTPEMEFGKLFATSCEIRKPLAPVTLYSEVEFPLKAELDGIHMVGYVDTCDLVNKKFREFKTSKTLWTSKKATTHGQLKMYALMLYLQYKIKPEDLQINLDCIQTIKNGNDVRFIEPFNIVTFDVKITMADILVFGNYIKTTVDKMERFAKAME